MFDFFDEVIEFLNQVVSNSNYISNFVDNMIASSSDAVVFISKFSLAFPSPFAWVLPASLVALMFDYVRGR